MMHYRLWRGFTRLLSLSGSASGHQPPRSARPRFEPLETRVVPAISIADVTVAEGNAGTTPATFAVSLSAVNEQTVTVVAQSADGTALAGSDYTALAATTLTFAPGTTTQNLIVNVLGDTLDEPNETFLVSLTQATGDTISDSSATGTITDDDAAPTLAVADVSVAEGASGTTAATFTVSLSAASGQTVTVVATTANGTAVAPGDFTALTGTTLTFAPGTTTQTVVVNVVGDTTVEADETFNLNLSAATNATIADATATGTITNDDPGLSISDVTVAEGNAGTTDVTFTVTLSPVATQTVTVLAQTVNGTATAGSDYVAVPATTLTFAPGTTTQTVVVTVNGDTTGEANETFLVNLSGATNAGLVDASGTGTITNDDPALTISDVTVAEGNSGSTAATFTVSLTPGATQTVTVVAQSANGTATAGSDYTALAATTLTFAPGTTTQTVVVNVTGDTLDEANETFLVNLSGATNATVVDASGTGTVSDDDAAPTVSINSVTVTEGNSGTSNAVFTVTLSAASGQQVTVQATTIAGTAVVGSDFLAISGQTLTFAPGTTTQTFSVPIVGDTTPEGTETYSVVLSGATNATLGTSVGTGTILDNDTSQPPPAASANECYVRQVYRDLLGREADSGGLANFVGLLDRGVLTRFGVALAIQTSVEYRVRAIDQIYQRYLGRSLDASGQATWLSFLAQGFTLEDVAARVIGSDEYYARAGGTVNGYLTAVYRDVLGRPLDASGQASWSAFLAAGLPRSWVADRILDSSESNQREVTELYQTLLRRNPDSGGLAALTNFLNIGGSNEAARASIIASDEYFARFCGPTA